MRNIRPAAYVFAGVVLSIVATALFASPPAMFFTVMIGGALVLGPDWG